jgi:hypothetical protein
MRQSQQVLEWQREARIETELQTRRADLLEALEVRFQSVPEDLARIIAELTDLAELRRWFRAALQADSLNAFRAAVQG